jgi:hypothetical protein
MIPPLGNMVLDNLHPFDVHCCQVHLSILPLLHLLLFLMIHNLPPQLLCESKFSSVRNCRAIHVLLVSPEMMLEFWNVHLQCPLTEVQGKIGDVILA